MTVPTTSRAYWSSWAGLAGFDALYVQRETFQEGAKVARRHGNRGRTDDLFGLVRLLDREMRLRVKVAHEPLGWKKEHVNTDEGGN